MGAFGPCGVALPGSPDSTGEIVIKVFSHWIRWTTVSRLVLGTFLLIVCLYLASHWPEQLRRLGIVDTGSTLLFLLALIVINIGIGAHPRTAKQAITQAHSEPP